MTTRRLTNLRSRSPASVQKTISRVIRSHPRPVRATACATGFVGNVIGTWFLACTATLIRHGTAARERVRPRPTTGAVAIVPSRVALPRPTGRLRLNS